MVFFLLINGFQNATNTVTYGTPLHVQTGTPLRRSAAVVVVVVRNRPRRPTFPRAHPGSAASYIKRLQQQQQHNI